LVLVFKLFSRMNRQETRLKITVGSQLILVSAWLVLAMVIIFKNPALVFAQENGTVLKGSVQEQDYLIKSTAPGLKRADINRGGDAFGSSPGPANNSLNKEFEAPADAFNVPSIRPPAPVPKEKNFNLNANTFDTSDFNGSAMNAMPAEPPAAKLGEGSPATDNNQPGNPQLQSQDPDNSPEMQLAWDEWHKGVATAIYKRFDFMAQRAFKYSKPLAAYVSYTVTKDGKIGNVRLQQKSTNVAFNAMVLLVVGSMSGQSDLLAFPAGSQRATVDQSGMFTQNYGTVQGFKYVTGDKEIVRGH
jgi:hypothetical protein